MRIETYLGTNKEEVESKKFNIWIGVSLGNSYFTDKNIKEYIRWAIKNTREDVLVVVADKIRAINYEVLDGKSESRSLKLAKREGDKKMEELRNILDSLPDEVSDMVRLARWRDVNKSKYHNYRLEVIYEEFNKEGDFYDYICSIVKEARPDRTMDKERVDGLAEYVLREIPVFVNGVKYNIKDNLWRTYGLIPYPGVSKLDELFMGLQNRSMFLDLSNRLKITDDIAILEAYVD